MGNSNYAQQIARKSNTAILLVGMLDEVDCPSSPRGRDVTLVGKENRTAWRELPGTFAGLSGAIAPVPSVEVDR